jgi:hypothetical protein
MGDLRLGLLLRKPDIAWDTAYGYDSEEPVLGGSGKGWGTNENGPIQYRSS